ncbi:hypothetical protein CYLTODRAFT_353220 [Cylindrobasidium torrendii FP15055 ss-10]|uniref:BZIP domain-containing protein n=1 Tax=Cylindrobasidium torrendii FP15055 ss-10 TaxID=1314674 RepID=A0A0D7BB24_9AGAR|nr:hypothetical protein CYLTODRAFT_353220 [Cylindrobasidium torrendii FP15055 ss-10]
MPSTIPPGLTTSSRSGGPSNQETSTSQQALPSTSTSSPADSPEGDDLGDGDKRRRNTAASARFRIKKKQRTLNLERSVNDLTGRAEELEREASDLRRENGWLKEIIMLKSSRLNLTPDTVTQEMWENSQAGEPGGSNQNPPAPDDAEEEGGDSSASEYTEDPKGKGKARAKGKSRK